MSVTPEQRATVVAKIKTYIRISHTYLDAEINDLIEACLSDLVICGIAEPDETDPAILSAIKLYARSNFEDDTNKAGAYLERYNSLKATLMMAEGYGGGEPDED